MRAAIITTLTGPADVRDRDVRHLRATVIPTELIRRFPPDQYALALQSGRGRPAVAAHTTMPAWVSDDAGRFRP